jgi:gamma-glutamyltranspeptidase / glutathione hydrolase
MQSSFGAHQAELNQIEVTPPVSAYSVSELRKMGYDVHRVKRTYNPTTAIWIDHEHGAMHGAASDYGIAW